MMTISPRTTRPAAPLKRPPARPVVLAVPDEDDRVLLTMALEAAGFSQPLLSVGDGRGLFDELRRREEADLPSLVVVDLLMPGMTGLETLSEMKVDPRLRPIPVVILADTRHEEDVRAAYRLGAAGYIAKPDRLSGLLSAVRDLGTYWLSLARLPHAAVAA